VQDQAAFYVPGSITPAPAPSTAPAAPRVPCDLTGCVAQGYLLVGGSGPMLLTTTAPETGNLLENGQFTIVVPASLTSGLVADYFVSSTTDVRLRVVLTDARGFKNTIGVLRVLVEKP